VLPTVADSGHEEPPLDPATEIDATCASVTPLEAVLDEGMIDELLHALLRRCWPEYTLAEVSVAEHRIDGVRPIALVVEDHRLRRVDRMLAGYREAGLAPFVPALARDRVGGTDRFRVLVPPVVECNGSGGHVVDGTHRLYTLLRHGVEAATVLAVAPRPDASFPPPAGRPGAWEDITSVAKKRDRKEGFQDFDPALFRPVAPYLSGGDLVFASEQDCRHQLEMIVKESR